MCNLNLQKSQFSLKIYLIMYIRTTIFFKFIFITVFTYIIFFHIFLLLLIQKNLYYFPTHVFFEAFLGAISWKKLRDAKEIQEVIEIDIKDAVTWVYTLYTSCLCNRLDKPKKPALNRLTYREMISTMKLNVFMLFFCYKKFYFMLSIMLIFQLKILHQV